MTDKPTTTAATTAGSSDANSKHRGTANADTKAEKWSSFLGVAGLTIVGAVIGATFGLVQHGKKKRLERERRHQQGDYSDHAMLLDRGWKYVCALPSLAAALVALQKWEHIHREAYDTIGDRLNYMIYCGTLSVKDKAVPATIPIGCSQAYKLIKRSLHTLFDACEAYYASLRQSAGSLREQEKLYAHNKFDYETFNKAAATLRGSARAMREAICERWMIS